MTGRISGQVGPVGHGGQGTAPSAAPSAGVASVVLGWLARRGVRDRDRDGARAASDADVRAREPRIAALRFVERTNAERRAVVDALHVGPAQNLAAALLGLEAVRTRLRPPAGSIEADNLRLVDEAITAAIREVRSIADTLRTPDVAQLGVADVMDRAIRASRPDPGVFVEARVGSLPPDVDLGTKIAVFHAVRDAVRFVDREQRAQSIDLELRWAGDWLTLDVLGCGGAEVMPMTGVTDGEPDVDDMDAVPSLARAGDHAALLGGSLAVRLEPGRVVRVRATWPLSADAGPGPGP